MIQYIKKNYAKIICIVSIILAVVIRFLCRKVESGDYETFLKGWVEFFRTNGGWQGLRHAVGDYNVVYQYILVVISYINFSDLYLIKIVSCIFDVLLAFGCAKLLGAAGVSKAKQTICFSVVLLMPTVWLNSAYWGQCDSIYVCFVVWSLYFLLKQRNYLSIAFLALAFTFKLQTIFIFPIFFIEFLRSNIKIRHAAVFPVTYMSTCVPALCFGKPFKDIIGIYFNQTTEYEAMTMNSPSVMQFFDILEYNAVIEKVAIVAALIFVLILCFAAWKKKDYSPKHIISLSLLFSIGIPFLLPHMHDRYFYMAGIIAVLYAFILGGKRIWLAVFVEFTSSIFYLHFFHLINSYGGVVSTHLMTHMNGAAFMFMALVSGLILYFYDFWYEKKDENKKAKPIRTVALGMVCVLALAVTVQSVLARDKTFLKVNGKLVNYKGPITHENDGVLMVPVRSVFNAGGYSLSFDKVQGCSVMKKGGETVTLNTGTNEAALNGEPVTLKHKCYIIKGYSYISEEDAKTLMNMTTEKKGNTVYFKDK